MPNDDNISMMSFAKNESQKNLIGMLIKTGVGSNYPEEEINRLIEIIFEKLDILEVLREDIIKKDTQILDIAKKSEVPVESIVDYFIFLSLLIENSIFIKRAEDLGLDLNPENILDPEED